MRDSRETLQQTNSKINTEATVRNNRPLSSWEQVMEEESEYGTDRSLANYSHACVVSNTSKGKKELVCTCLSAPV